MTKFNDFDVRFRTAMNRAAREGLSGGDASDLVRAIRLVVECAHQGDADFCGEQRDFHLPRLREAMTLLMQMFPRDSFAAFEQAEDAYGRKLSE